MASDRWRDIAQQIREGDPSQTIGHRLCAVASQALRGRAASLALVIDNSYSAIASSDQLATLLDEQQFAVGDGPTFDARVASAPVIADDLRQFRATHRWPAFTSVAATHDVRGVFAFPLRVGNAYLGVLTVYRTEAGELTTQQFSDGLVLASIATAELIRHEAGVASPESPDMFDPGLYDQSALQIAAGMVSESLNCSIVVALVRIRARAYADDAPVSEIARAIVARELVLEK